MLVKHCPSFARQVGQVARVQTDAHQVAAHPPELVAGLDGISDPFKGIVGIDQQHRIMRKEIDICLEGLGFAVKSHDPAVGVGTADR